MKKFAIVLHGGAGVISKALESNLKATYERSLEKVWVEIYSTEEEAKRRDKNMKKIHSPKQKNKTTSRH